MGKSESDTMVSAPVLGQLTYREWHGFVDGVYCGYVEEQENEYEQEKHYWRTGYLLGTAVRKHTN